MTKKLYLFAALICSAYSMSGTAAYASDDDSLACGVRSKESCQASESCMWDDQDAGEPLCVDKE